MFQRRLWSVKVSAVRAALWLAATACAPAQEPVLRQADEALAQGDFSEARQGYQLAADGSPAPARALLGAGRAAFAQADYEGAAKHFNHASLARDVGPADEALALAGKAAAWFEPARETMEENAVAYALDDLGAALGRDPRCAPALVWRGYLRTLRARSHQDEDEALADLRKARELGEDGWLLYLARGCVAIGHGDTAERDKAFAAARQRLDAELKSRPLHLHAWLKSVELDERTGDADRLASDHSEILKRWPDRVASLAARGHAHVLRRDFPAAVADCTAAIDKGDRRALVYWWRGYARTWTGDHDGAFADLSEAIVLNPDLEGPLTRRAWLHNARGECSRAVDDANRALERWPDNPDALSERGYAYKELGQASEAVSDFDLVLKSNPDNPTILRYRAEAKNILGDFSGARDDASAAIAIAPGDGYAWRARTVARIGLREFDLAITDADKTVELLPEHAPAYINRGAARREQKRFADALNDYDKAVALDPSNPAWYRDRADVHQEMGNREKAEEDVGKAQRLEAEALPVER
jgi:tetratricopeptide (TPR) repeat protein